MRFVLAALVAIALPPAVPAQAPDRGPDTTIDAATRARVIDGVLQRLDEGYVFPEKANQMAAAIRERAHRERTIGSPAPRPFRTP